MKMLNLTVSGVLRYSRIALSLALLALLGCAGKSVGLVEANWGKAYRQTMSSQISNEDAPDEDLAPIVGTDALTAEIVVENYKLDVERGKDEARDVFLFEAGIQ